MIRTIKFSFITSLIFLLIAGFSYSNPVKRALIIAIGNYPYGSGFSSIGSLNDVPLIKTSLINQSFSEENIKILLNSQATRNGIISAFDELINLCNPGDIVVIHYSGHGQQMQDSTNSKQSGIDEALVPYDAKILPTADYYGQNHIRDHLIGEYIKQFRLKLGKDGMLNLFIDACFSGSMTKALNVFRSTTQVFGTPGFLEEYDKGKTNIPKSAGIYNCIKEISEDNDNLSGFVFFAPCRFDQPCCEIEKNGTSVGPLSYGISKAFTNINTNETYRQLYQKIYAAIKASSGSRQEPQAEGNLDNIVFSGLINVTKPYYSIIDRNIDNELILNGGEFSGIYKGTLIGFYPGETNDPAGVSPVFETVIKKVNSFNSIITGFDKPYEEILKMRIFVLRQGIPEMDMKVKFESLGEKIISNLTEEFKSVQYIKISDSISDYILTGINPGSNASDGKLYIISAEDGSSNIEPLDLNSDSLSQKVTENLKDLYVYNMLRNLPLSDKNYVLDVTVGKYIISGKDTIISPLEEISGVKNTVLEDTLLISVINSGSANEYITLLGFSPEGKIVQLYPYEEMSQSNKLLKGNRINFIFVNSKTGLFLFKFFATREFINFRPIIRSRKKVNFEKSEANILEELLADSYSGRKYGIGSFSGGSAVSLYLKIIEKQ
jgi:metacaspase-1